MIERRDCLFNKKNTILQASLLPSTRPRPSPCRTRHRSHTLAHTTTRHDRLTTRVCQCHTRHSLSSPPPVIRSHTPSRRAPLCPCPTATHATHTRHTHTCAPRRLPHAKPPKAPAQGTCTRCFVLCGRPYLARRIARRPRVRGCPRRARSHSGDSALPSLS